MDILVSTTSFRPEYKYSLELFDTIVLPVKRQITSWEIGYGGYGALPQP